MSTPEELNPSAVLILECQKTLGTGKDYTMPHALTCFETSLWALEENGELTSDAKKKLIFAKNVLLRDIVMNQVKTIGQFKIESPFKNTCDKCHGSGEVYKFRRKSKKVRCMKCTDGKIILDCTSCGSTGIYRKKIDEGEGEINIDVECRSCKGKNIDGKSKKTQVQFKCPTCRGKQLVKKFAIIEEIKSTTPCRFCGGIGIRKPKPERLPDNPVMPVNLGSAIKASIKDSNNIPIQLVDESTQKESSIKFQPGGSEPSTSDADKQILDEGCFQNGHHPPAE